MQEEKAKVINAANVLEEKAITAADNLENSKLGDVIPLEIVSLPLYDLTKYLMFFIIFDAIPTYLISCVETKGTVTTWIIRVRDTLFITATIVSTVVNLLAFYAKMITLYKLVVPIALIKTAIAVVVILTSSFYSFITVCLALLYVVRVMVLDSLFLYYLVILLKRIESDEYDNNGEKIVVSDPQAEKV